MKQDLTFIW